MDRSLPGKTFFYTLLFLLLLLPVDSSAQKEYFIWHFGNGGTLDFHTVPPSTIPGGNALNGYLEASSGICDKSGNLLFYTNGDTVYNRKHQYMKNGISAVSRFRISAVQGAYVLKYPDNDSLYYIFTAPAWENFKVTGDQWLRYWIVNMKGDGGLGEVIVKDEPILPGSFETQAITLHANRKDYWISNVNYSNGCFEAVRTVNGLVDTTTKVSQPLADFTKLGYLTRKSSPDSKIIVANQSFKAEGLNRRWFINLYKFNNATGQISDRLIIETLTHNENGLYLEFSPDSKKLYVVWQVTVPTFGIRQFDLSTWDSTAVANSEFEVEERPFARIGNLQLGPDGKIYCFYWNDSKMSVIHNPNALGYDCDFKKNSIDVSPGKNASGGFYYPFWVKELKINLPKDTLLCYGQKIELIPDLLAADSFRWNTGAKTRTITADQPGVYIVTAWNAFESASDTMIVTYGNKFNVFLGNDTSFCGAFSHILLVDKGAQSYKWSTGDTVYTITVDSGGTYWISVRDKSSCHFADTIDIRHVKRPKLQMSMDTSGCEFVFLSAAPALAGATYTWSTGDTGVNTKVKSKGNYYLNTKTQFCLFSDSIKVSKLPQPGLTLGPDKPLCSGSGILLSADEGDSYLWSTGDTLRQIKADKPGHYWVKVKRNGCEVLDEITLTPCDDLNFFIPRAFTPNKDGRNDLFTISGSNIVSVSMKIYNRWGEKIFEGQGESVGWDGTYSGAECAEGVYYCVVSVKGLHKGFIITRNSQATITLYR